MYKINMEDKTLKRIEGVTFKDMNALERQHIHGLTVEIII